MSQLSPWEAVAGFILHPNLSCHLSPTIHNIPALHKKRGQPQTGAGREAEGREMPGMLS